MKTVHAFTLFVILLLVTMMSGASHASEKQPVEYLFVLAAQSGTYSGEHLRLKGVPLAVFFSDRPSRIAGHITLDELMDDWNKGKDSFKSDPPNATLSFNVGNKEKTVSMEIANPEYEIGVLSFKVLKILQGSLPAEFGTSVLYIDDYSGGAPMPYVP